MEKKSNCSDCKLRARYDNAPRSLLGRFWRWHINFCPGWKAYMASLEPSEQEELKRKYNLKK